MLPDDAIVGSIEAKLPNRFGVGEEIGEQRAEFEAKILVEQQFHAAVKTRGHPPQQYAYGGRKADRHACPALR